MKAWSSVGAFHLGRPFTNGDGLALLEELHSLHNSFDHRWDEKPSVTLVFFLSFICIFSNLLIFWFTTTPLYSKKKIFRRIFYFFGFFFSKFQKIKSKLRHFGRNEGLKWINLKFKLEGVICNLAPKKKKKIETRSNVHWKEEGELWKNGVR